MNDKEQIVTTPEGLLVRAPAKINLSLLVAGKRPDSFHEIESLIAKIAWYDEILIQPGPGQDIRLSCRGPEWAPPGADNLVYKAATQLLRTAGRTAEMAITLTKNVPAGSGLGSASSDAAATLIGLNHYLGLPLPRSKLQELAARLGSDVPFFLNGPLALCKGKGEKITELHKKIDFLALLILPDVNISTKKVYENYRHDPDLYRSLSGCVKSHILENRIDLVLNMCANMLEKSCFELAESLALLKSRLESLGPGRWRLSGSGSAMFTVFDCADQKKAEHYRDLIQRKTKCKCIVVRNNRW